MSSYRKTSKRALKQFKHSSCAMSDQEIRIKCLEISSKIHYLESAFILIAQSAALFTYVKTGKYSTISGSQDKLIELERKYLSTTICEQITEKRNEAEKPHPQY